MGIAESERASEREPLEGIEAWLTRQRLQSGDPKTQLNGEPRALGGVETWLAREQSVEKIDQLSMYIRTVWFVCEAAQFAMLAAGSIAAGGAPPLLSSVRMVGALLAARWPTLFVVFVVHALSNAQRLQRWPVQRLQRLPVQVLSDKDPERKKSNKTYGTTGI
ncbi:hypothetical protein T492DRAFT_843200 [Pavlovales sp. CCMP2436]|nr:hypothetical protein T492DRAFT_843200 [Pavlovales sp. CCMP2436]